MKIVLATSHYPPTYMAGVELYTQRLARWLVANGHEAEVICVERIDSPEHLSIRSDDENGVVVHRLGLKLAGRGQHLGFRYQDKAIGTWFASYLDRTRPDVVHSHSSYLLTVSVIDAARRKGIPVILTLHDYWFFCPRINLVRSDGKRCTGRVPPAECAWCLMAERRRYRWMDHVTRKLGALPLGHNEMIDLRPWLVNNELLAAVGHRQAYLESVLRSVDRIIVLGPMTRDLLIDHNIPSAKIQRLSLGLDRASWRGISRPPRSGGLRLGYLGQLAPHKGVHLLIEAFRGLNASGREPVLSIYGDPNRFPRYTASLQKLARQDPRIQFRGPYDHAHVEEVLAQIDVLVVPSQFFETRPAVLMEAAFARVPVVASRLPNLTVHVRDGVDGLLFDPDDVRDLTRQLQRLIDEPGLVDRFAQKLEPGRTFDDEMAEILEIYRSATRQDCVYPR